MSIIESLVQNDSNSANLCSELEIVREITSHAPAVLTIAQPNESLFLEPSHLSSLLRAALRRMWDAASKPPAWSLPSREVTVEALVEDNLSNREEEPEDAILVASDLLPRLLAQARQVPPSLDWERYLDEL